MSTRIKNARREHARRTWIWRIMDVLLERTYYGGRKGRSAFRRIRRTPPPFRVPFDPLDVVDIVRATREQVKRFERLGLVERHDGSNEALVVALIPVSK